MRSREEIEKMVNTNPNAEGPWRGPATYESFLQSAILELLLDIRDLLGKDKTVEKDHINTMTIANTCGFNSNTGECFPGPCDGPCSECTAMNKRRKDETDI